MTYVGPSRTGSRASNRSPTSNPDRRPRRSCNAIGKALTSSVRSVLRPPCVQRWTTRNGREERRVAVIGVDAEAEEADGVVAGQGEAEQGGASAGGKVGDAEGAGGAGGGPGDRADVTPGLAAVGAGRGGDEVFRSRRGLGRRSGGRRGRRGVRGGRSSSRPLPPAGAVPDFQVVELTPIVADVSFRGISSRA